MSTIWKKPVSAHDMQRLHVQTAVEHLGIEFLLVGSDFVTARVKVDSRTQQPFGVLHGGVSVVLAEALGSSGANFACPEGHKAVGLEVNANHVRSAAAGTWVTGVARPVHIGRTTQVWQIDIKDEGDRLVCASRITLAILPAG